MCPFFSLLAVIFFFFSRQLCLLYVDVTTPTLVCKPQARNVCSMFSFNLALIGSHLWMTVSPLRSVHPKSVRCPRFPQFCSWFSEWPFSTALLGRDMIVTCLCMSCSSHPRLQHVFKKFSKFLGACKTALNRLL